MNRKRGVTYLSCIGVAAWAVGVLAPGAAEAIPVQIGGDIVEVNGEGINILLPIATYDTSACCTFSNGSQTWTESQYECSKETAASCCYDRSVGWGWGTAWTVLDSRTGSCSTPPPPPDPNPECRVFLCSRSTNFGGYADYAAGYFGYAHEWVKWECPDENGNWWVEERGLGQEGGIVPGGENQPEPEGCGTEIVDHSGQSEAAGATCVQIAGTDVACLDAALPIGQACGDFCSIQNGVINQCNQTAIGAILSCGGRDWCRDYGLKNAPAEQGLYPACLKPALDGVYF
jgi:hypothetical protein